MTPTDPPELVPPRPRPLPARCVLVVDEGLPPGLAANAAAVLALSVGARFPGLPGPDLLDADGGVHLGLIPMGLPVLAASQEHLQRLRALTLDDEVDVIDFPTAGQQTTDYAAFGAVVTATRSADLTYLGVAVCGPAKRVRKVTGGLPLLR